MEQTERPVASALPATPQTLAVQSQTDHIILLGLRYFTYEKTLCRPTTVARMIVMKTGIQKRKNSVCAGMNSWRGHRMNHGRSGPPVGGMWQAGGVHSR